MCRWFCDAILVAIFQRFDCDFVHVATLFYAYNIACASALIATKFQQNRKQIAEKLSGNRSENWG